MLTKIYQTIKDYHVIIIHRHQRPDGDALGAQLGLRDALRLTYPTKEIYAVGDITDRLSWMGSMDEIDDSKYKEALVIVVDTGAEGLISDSRYKLARKVIKLDHHIPQGEYGTIQFVDTSYESCSSLITDYIIEKRYKINDSVATSLFIGIVTDSGRFKYNSTNSKTFKAASNLFKYNIDLDYIYTKLYSEKLSSVKLKANMTLKYIYEEPGIAYLINKYEEILEYNSTPNEISKSTIGLMNGIDEVKAWCSFTYDSNGDIYLELRSPKFNVNKIATKYGGGGHFSASGATITDETLIPTIIEDLKKLIKGEEIC